ncbi:unnamed protein product, partial [Allacma fusca]
KHLVKFILEESATMLGGPVYCTACDLVIKPPTAKGRLKGRKLDNRHKYLTGPVELNTVLRYLIS